MTTFTTDDRESCYPPHVVTSGASPKTPKTLAEYIEQEGREEMLRHQLDIASEEIRKLQEENMKLKREIENLMNGRC